MNEQLLEKLLHYLNTAENFVSSQLPDFAQQFVNYEIWACNWWFWLTLTATIFFFIISMITWIVGMVSNDPSEQCGCGVLLGLMGIVFIGFFFGTAHNYSKLKQLEIAPKVYMIKQAKDLFTGGKK